MATVEHPPAASGAVSGPSSPFKFLDYFTETPEDRRRFGGREREIRELVARIANERTLILYGRSGIGKTSLLLAGIFPELQARGFRPVYTRLLSDPLTDLSNAIRSICEQEDPVTNLQTALRRAAAERPLVLVIDQFEELFIRFQSKPDLRARLVEAVTELVGDRSLDVTVVFSLREDYLAELDAFRSVIPDLFEHQYRLRSLTAFGARQAVTRPMLDAGIPYDEVVVNRLVDQLEPVEFDPTLLQILCSELFRGAANRSGGTVSRITSDDFGEIGSIDAIFRRYLQGSSLELPEKYALLARLVLNSLIARGSTKRAATLQELVDAEFLAEEYELNDILGILVRKGLLRHQIRGEDAWFELVHERLVPHLKDWLNADRQFRQFETTLEFVRSTSRAKLWSFNPEALLNEALLGELLNFCTGRGRLREPELEFVFRSAVYRRSPSVSVWAAKLGNERSALLITQLLQEENEKQRWTAVVAAREIQDFQGILAQACLRLAFHDSSELVRKEAGLSLAKLARSIELEDIREALRDPTSHIPAQEVLAGLYLGGHPLTEVPWLRRQFARRRAEQRLLGENKDLIQARRRIGLRLGALASLIWIVTVGLATAMCLAGLLRVVTSVEEWLRMVASIVGTILMPAVVFGAILGASTATGAAREALLSKDERWLRALLKGRVLLVNSLGLATALGLVLFTDFTPSLGQDYRSFLAEALLAAGVLGFFGSLLIGLCAGLIQPAIWPHAGRWTLWGWMFLACLGPPILLALLAAASLGNYYSGFSAAGSTWISVIGGISLASLGVFSSLIATAASASKILIVKLSPQSGRAMKAARLCIGVCTTATLAYLSTFITPKLIPPISEREYHIPTQSIYHSDVLEPRGPGVRYFRVCNPRSEPLLMLVREIRGPAATILGRAANTALASAADSGLATVPRLSVGDLLLFPSGCHLGSFRLATPVNRPFTQSIWLKEIPELTAEGLASFLAGQPTRREVELASSRSGVWSGHIDFTALLTSLELTTISLRVAPQEYTLMPPMPDTSLEGSAETYDEIEATRKARLAFSVVPETAPREALILNPSAFALTIHANQAGRWRVDFRVRARELPSKTPQTLRLSVLVQRVNR